MRLFSNNISTRVDPLAPRGPGARLSIAIAVFAAVAAIASTPAEAQLDQTINAQVKTDKAAAATQDRIDKLSDQTDDAASKYARAKDEAESLERYNKQLNEQVKSQEDKIASIQEQLDGIEKTTREVQPLMEQMIQSLDQFVSLDVPFLIDQRKARIQNLKNVMSRADIAISEKYRLILEAYQIELDYGRTLSAYRGELDTGGQPRTVQFVQIGRITLMYQTLDGAQTGYWDQNKKAWVVDNSYGAAFKQALMVATQDGAPELMTVPVPAPEEIHS